MELHNNIKIMSTLSFFVSRVFN